MSELRSNPTQYGSWIVRDVRVVWRMDNKELPLNATQVQVRDSASWSAPETLSGQVYLHQQREYSSRNWDNSERPGVVRDLPKEITLTFPRLPTGFYHWMRSLHTFPRRFVVELDLFTSRDPEPLMTPDGRHYYASCGGWKPDSVKLYRNGQPLNELLDIDYQWGVVIFPEPQPRTDEITVTYVWAPEVSCTGELVPEFATGRFDREFSDDSHQPEATVRVTLQEHRSAPGTRRLLPERSVNPTGIAASTVFGGVKILLPGYSDSFNRPNGPVGTLDTGQSWSNQSFQVEDGRMALRGNATYQYLTPISADGYFEARLWGDPEHENNYLEGTRFGWIQGPRLMFRVVSNVSHFLLGYPIARYSHTASHYGLNYYNGNVSTTYGNVFYRPLRDGDRVGVLKNGERIEFYLNRMLVGGADVAIDMTRERIGFTGSGYVDDFRYYLKEQIPEGLLLPRPTGNHVYQDDFMREKQFLSYNRYHRGWFAIYPEHTSSCYVENGFAHTNSTPFYMATNSSNGVVRMKVWSNDPVALPYHVGNPIGRYSGGAYYTITNDLQFGGVLLRVVRHGASGTNLVRSNGDTHRLAHGDVVELVFDGEYIGYRRNGVLLLESTYAENLSAMNHGFNAQPGFASEWSFTPR